MSARATDDELLRTYRYLRMGIVAAVVVMVIAVFDEGAKAGCLRGSISAYYYSPVRSVFVGCLMAIGLALIAVRGRGIEEVLLNLAGMCAPVVALVPMRPGLDCASTATVTPEIPPLKDTDELPEWILRSMSNNVRAYLITAAIVVALMALLGCRRYFKSRGKNASADDRKEAKFYLLATAFYAAFVVVGFVALATFDRVNPYTHFIAAATMFVCFGAVAVVNAVRFRQNWHGYAYGLTAGLMALAVCVILPFILIDGERGAHETEIWHTATFWLEFILIALFAIFWAVQTEQHWKNDKPPTAAEEMSSPAANATK